MKVLAWIPDEAEGPDAPDPDSAAADIRRALNPKGKWSCQFKGAEVEFNPGEIELHSHAQKRERWFVMLEWFKTTPGSGKGVRVLFAELDEDKSGDVSIEEVSRGGRRARDGASLTAASDSPVRRGDEETGAGPE